VETGWADRSLLARPVVELLDMRRGRELYETHVRRPSVTRGARPKTAQRSKGVSDKFLAFAGGRGLTAWN